MRPGRPAGPVIITGEDTLSLFWGPPANRGGNYLVAYDLRYKLSSASSWTVLETTLVENVWTYGSGTLSRTIGSLTRGVPYDFQVRAHSLIGADGCAAMGGLTTATPPGQISPAKCEQAAGQWSSTVVGLLASARRHPVVARGRSGHARRGRVVVGGRRILHRRHDHPAPARRRRVGRWCVGICMSRRARGRRRRARMWGRSPQAVLDTYDSNLDTYGASIAAGAAVGDGERSGGGGSSGGEPGESGVLGGFGGVRGLR